jgi:integrase-like protein
VSARAFSTRDQVDTLCVHLTAPVADLVRFLFWAAWRVNEVRRLEWKHCLQIFHRHSRPIGDFRKVWTRACAAIGLEGRIVHDLRRSGVKHLIDSGFDPHIVMAFSGHRTPSMLRHRG